MEAKVHHIAFVNAKELVKDGYKIVDYGYDELKAESRYNLIHDNGNRIDIISAELTNQVEIYKNKRLNKVIKV
jgi:hypothetical protein